MSLEHTGLGTPTIRHKDRKREWETVLLPCFECQLGAKIIRRRLSADWFLTTSNLCVWSPDEPFYKLSQRPIVRDILDKCALTNLKHTLLGIRCTGFESTTMESDHKKPLWCQRWYLLSTQILSDRFILESKFLKAWGSKWDGWCLVRLCRQTVLRECRSERGRVFTLTITISQKVTCKP